MVIKSFTSSILNKEFDKRFAKLDIRSFCRFRSFMSSYGLTYNSFASRKYTLTISMTENNFTKFGEVLMYVNAKCPGEGTNGEKWINEDGTFNVSSLRFDFEKDITDETSDIAKGFIDLFELADIKFVEREHNIETQKKLYGTSVNDTLNSLGATPVERRSYWKNMIDKRIITPAKFMGFLNFIDSKCKDSKLTKEDLEFLPKDGTLAKQIMDAYLEARPTCQIV